MNKDQTKLTTEIKAKDKTRQEKTRPDKTQKYKDKAMAKTRYEGNNNNNTHEIRYEWQ